MNAPNRRPPQVRCANSHFALASSKETRRRPASSGASTLVAAARASDAIGVAMASLARAAATSVLAPDDAGRRLVSFDDASAKWLFAHLTWGGRLFGAFIALRALHRTVGVPQVIDDATQMLFATVIAVLIIHLLTGRREAGEEEGRRIPGMRLLAW